jgi:oligopeptidase B
MREPTAEDPLTGSSAAAPPVADRRPHPLVAHGDERIDDWYWLADREDPSVTDYLRAENAWAESVLAPTEPLQLRLFEQIRSRVAETDAGPPTRHGPWWYWSRTVEGRQYPIVCRRADPSRQLRATQVVADARAGRGDEEVVLDQNALAQGSEYFALGVLDVSPDHRVLAWADDLDGSERHTLRFRDLERGEVLPDVVTNVSHGSAWAADNRTFFYVRPDEAMRPFQVWRHELGSPSDTDTLVYQEDDERFFLSVRLTRSERFVVVQAESKTTSESRWIDAHRPGDRPVPVWERQAGVEYDVDHAVGPDGADVWLVRHNRPDGAGTDPGTNFVLDQLPVAAGAGQTVGLVPARVGVKLKRVDGFAGRVVVTERADGLDRFRVLRLGEPGPGVEIAQPEPVYALAPGENPEFDTTTFRFDYTSLVTPHAAVDYDLVGGRREVVWSQPVLGDWDPARYRSERIWARAPDGTSVPISLVARADQPLDGTAPGVLYGYGAYEITIDPSFSPSRLNLLERGVVFAIAHVRGGGELGRRWYEDGKLNHKPNTFSDFIACAEQLTAAGWVDPARLAIRGGSAGGLLMGAVTNARPGLWRAVVAEVPFVDVVTTMSDASLPLTVTEWEEWGDPVDDPEAYRVMLSYSPYDNVRVADYPAMYVTGGLNDPRVGYWEPAKWVAKLRAMRSDDRTLLLRTEMGAGHQGASGRYDAWRDEARIQAFLLLELGAER